MSQYISYSSRNSGGGGGGGVTTLNGETGAITLVAGSGISITPAGQNITIAATGGGGTVTSVALADSTNLFNITGSPVTTSGTLTLASFKSQAQHSFFSGPSGSSGAPTFRAIVQSDISGSANAVSYFNASGILADDSNVSYFVNETQTFPPFAARGFYAQSDLINLANTGFVFSSTDTSTDSFTTNLGMITGANLSVAATNATGGVLFGTGEISDSGATANTGAVNIFTGPNNASGTSGGITVASGQTSAGNSGSLLISSGNSSGIGSSGAVNINTGSSSGGSSGDLKISAGPSDGIAFNGEASFGTAPVIVSAASADSGVVQVESGPILDAAATGASGALTLKSGDNFGLGNSGNISLQSGGVTSGSGTSGTNFISTGNTDAGNSGLISFFTGSSNSGSSGVIDIITGNSSSSSSGVLNIKSGDSTSVGNSGVINIITGNADQATGGLFAQTGASANGNTGDIAFSTGTASVVDSGSVNFTTGDATIGNSGNLLFQTGTSGTTRGQLIFKDGSEGVAGYVWTSTDTAGRGAWIAASGGGANTALSNLASTAVNADILPDSDGIHSLGSSSFEWNTLWAGNLSFGGQLIFNISTSTINDPSGIESADFSVRELYNIGGNTVLSWQTQVLNRSSGSVTSLDWDNSLLVNSSAVPILNWSSVIGLSDTHIVSSQTTDPTVTVSANAGGGASGSVTTATDIAGIVNLTTGTITLSSGAQITVNFNTSFDNAPIVILTPRNAVSGATTVGTYVTSTTGDFTVNFATASLGTQAYSWFYHVIGT